MPMLFELTITHKAYVLAENEDEAKDMQSDVERWESFPEIEVEAWCGGTLDGWNDGCLVYHDGEQDISLGEAKKMVTPNVQN